MTRRPIVCATLTVMLLSVVLLADDALDPMLEAGQPIERQLARGEQHRYRLPMTTGEYARVIVEQRGIDVSVEVRGGDGSAIADFDDEVRSIGEEQIDVVADRSGGFIVAIKAAAGIVVAGSYAIRVDGRRAATDADRSMQESRTLRTAAARLDGEGRFDEARRLLERALTVTEAVRGPDDVQTAAVAAQLAGVYRKLPDRIKSESLYLRAITVMERTLGGEHPTTALVRSQLALLYENEGERRKAEALLRQALDVIEKTLGSEHPSFVSCLITLGDLRDSAGDLEEEEEIIQRGLAILEKSDDTISVQYAALLNNLGEVYRQKLDYTRAEALLQRSLALAEKLLGPDNYTVATALQNLGIVARERKDYATAVAYNTRALSIRERTVGLNHPDVAHILTNLANIYRATGDTSRSLDTHLRALAIWENAAGPYQQATLLSVGNIARTYAAAGDMTNAIAYQYRADAILEKELALNLAIGSERQKLVFVKSVSARTDRTISLHLREAPEDPAAGALAALVLLQRKGRVLDAMIDTFATVRQRMASTDDQGLLDRSNAVTAELARFALSAPEAEDPEVRQIAIKDLEAKKERLEEELAEHSAEFRAQMQPVTLEAVQAAMPDDAALLEFAIFRPFRPKAERNAESYGPPHYAGYVVRRHSAPRGIDLGPADTIDRAIDALRQAVRDPRRTDLNAQARKVDELVVEPLRSSFGGAARLLISPDGELNLVPFEALVDEDGRYLIERYAMSYLTSGRDLLRMQVARTTRSQPVIVADPVFGEPGVPRLAPRAQRLASLRAKRRSVTTVDDVSAVYFAPLAATADEARAIKRLFPEATLFTGQRATKAALLRVEAPRMLHIASHGFFVQDTRVNVENPLLRSGLALAGANLTRDSHRDGILTALEASGLNLWGTKLVTLSACDTGVGEVRNGEGVYGLRRAFVLAGAETVVMSLWPVSDAVARETMVAYYTGLRAGLGRADALRQAKLALMNRPSRQHPFYWAAFIQSGEWANLDGKR
ncbi:MAG TPA: CHAT domain-containing tetratricopeptide repeat protein [Vicinamibacterales bacterium]|nr:CHAT domain-containing tetratricopeptide repeat protein [Vicinamibacterales bacterium]